MPVMFVKPGATPFITTKHLWKFSSTVFLHFHALLAYLHYSICTVVFRTKQAKGAHASVVLFLTPFVGFENTNYYFENESSFAI